MYRDALTWLERACETQAPALLDEVRRLTALAPDLELTAGLSGDSVALDDPDAAAEGVGAPSSASTRYLQLDLLGTGGMGEVWRVRDLELNRVVAMKRVRADLGLGAAATARFVEEIQTTAQLQHPGIVPVYDAGRGADGRVWFTMKEIRGRTFGEVVHDVHVASLDRWSTSPDGWNLRRLVGALHQASQAVAYAHQRGVVHRDLKPANLMVGPHGEVLVMDWGLCKVRGREDAVTEQVVVERAREATRMGQVMGTPAFMSPEQARGESAAIDARSDVYALGAMLYQVLAGRAPYQGETGPEVILRVLEGPPPPPTRTTWTDAGDAAEQARDRGLSPVGALGDGPELPAELAEICARAMARDPEDRHADADAFADDLRAWLDGSKRRERALELVTRAQALVPQVEALRALAASRRAEAAAALATVPGWAPEEDKLAAWRLQDEAAEFEARASLASLERDQLLAGALTHAPDLPEAHAVLAEDQRARHQEAEAARDRVATSRAETLLRAHVDVLPASHEVRRRCAAYLRGVGAVTLVTDPDGAQVELLRFERRGRRLVAEPSRHLGRAPLVELPLEMGSYLLVVRHPGRATVRYPIRVDRGAHWDGVRPGSTEPFPIHLPDADALGPDDRYVPAGWFEAGGTMEYGALPIRSRRWCDAFVVRSEPVTNRAYLAFLDDLVARGREAEALGLVPRDNAGQQGAEAPPIYGRDAAGRFALVPDPSGDLWDPDWPVVMIDWRSAVAYARWEAERSGLAWRLPWDLEWEKAARGVDGRPMPWGDASDPSFACVRDSHRGRPLPSKIGSYPLDESVYGVRGLGGNVMDWCVDVWSKAGTPGDVVAPFEDQGEAGDLAQRVIRGGHWLMLAGGVRSAYRYGNGQDNRLAYVGFRLGRSWRDPSAR